MMENPFCECGCGQEVGVGKRFVWGHNRRISKNSQCIIEGCNGIPIAHGLCRRHYDQVYRNGEIYDRTIYDPNEIIIAGDICKIQCYDRKGNPKCQVLIDLEDLSIVQGYKWTAGRNGTQIENSKIGLLSRLILGITNSDIVVDHINHNELDNRKSNLRACLQSQNTRNTKKRSDNTSGYKGVTWSKQKNRWQVQVTLHGKTKSKFFIDIEEANNYAKQLRAELHGEFACDQ
jgi:hypothetical protein